MGLERLRRASRVRVAALRGWLLELLLWLERWLLELLLLELLLGECTRCVVGRDGRVLRRGRVVSSFFVDDASGWGSSGCVYRWGEEVCFLDGLGPDGRVTAIMGDEGEDEEGEGVSQYCPCVDVRMDSSERGKSDTDGK